MSSVAAQELRTLRRHIHQVAGRQARQLLTGKVVPGSQDLETRTLRLELATGANGQPILSPPVRWQEPAAGRLKVHSVPADNEQMVLHSPSGTIGSASIAVSASYDDDNSPPSNSDEEAVWTFGDDVRIAVREDRAYVKAPQVTVESGDVQLGGDGGERVARVGDRVDVAGKLWPIVEGSSKVRAVD
jgi:hypothetical protein